MKPLIRFTSADILTWIALIAAVISIEMHIGYHLVTIVFGIGCVLTSAIACWRYRRNSTGAGQTFVILAGGVSVAFSFIFEIFVCSAWREHTEESLFESIRVATSKVFWSVIWIFIFAIATTLTYLLSICARYITTEHVFDRQRPGSEQQDGS